VKALALPHLSPCLVVRFKTSLPKLSLKLSSSSSHSCSVGAGGRHRHAGELITSTDDTLAARVGDICHVLVFVLGTLPNLYLTTTAEDTNAHGGKKVVSSVGVEIDTAVENCGGILADSGGDESLATWVLLDEVSHIVDNTGNGNETPAILGLRDEVIPVNDGQLLKRNTPVKLRTLLVELLLELLNTSLLNLVLAELLEVRCEAELLPSPDAPLSGVVLPPLNSVAVVGGELVVEVVVSLAKGNESSDDMVTRRVAVVEGLVTEPVGQGVDAEGGLLDDEDAEDTAVDVAAEPVTPA